MLYKNGSIIGVDNIPNSVTTSGVYDLNAVQQSRQNNTFPIVLSKVLLESRSTAGSANVWTQSTYTIDGTSLAGSTGRWVVHHRNTISFTCDVQYDSITLQVAGGDVTYDFDTDNEGFQCTNANANPGQSILNYPNATFADVITGSSGAMRFMRDAAGTPSSSTGGTNGSGIDHSLGTTAGFYVYYEGSGSGTSSSPGSGFLRSPEVTLASTGTIEWYQSEHGSNLNSTVRDVYWIFS